MFITLTELARDVHIDPWQLGPDLSLGPARSCRIQKRTLRGGLRDGVEVVEVDNGTLKFTILVTRGMGLWRVEHLTGGWPLAWQSPLTGPVHPQFVPLDDPQGIGWLRGFDELLVRCGLESNGPPEFDSAGRVTLPLHGRIANLPAHTLSLSVDPETGAIAVTGSVDETRLFAQKLRLTTTYRTWPGSSRIEITDEVRNLGPTTAELELLYHINVGAPLLEEGATVSVPVKRLAPKTPLAAAHIETWNRYPAPGDWTGELVYCFDLWGDAQQQTQVVLANSRANRGLTVKFNRRELPYFVLWKNAQHLADGYVTGLEPTLNFPNAKSFEKRHGRVLQLPGGTSFRAVQELELLDGATAVSDAQADVHKISAGRPATILSQVDPNWAG